MLQAIPGTRLFDGLQRQSRVLNQFTGDNVDGTTSILPLDYQRFLSFFRAGIRLGMLGEDRFRYWQLILWTLIRRPKLISVAVTLSIYGRHYRKICERYIY
jgi:hypothetical protein